MVYKENIFTQIVCGQIKTTILGANESFISFYDIKPQAPTHILVVSKNQYINYDHFLKCSTKEEKEDYHNIIYDLVKKFNLDNFKIVTNSGKESGQEIFHFHVHILAY
jgi:histidine triad (HIT) family protein